MLLQEVHALMHEMLRTCIRPLRMDTSAALYLLDATQEALAQWVHVAICYIPGPKCRSYVLTLGLCMYYTGDPLGCVLASSWGFLRIAGHIVSQLTVFEISTWLSSWGALQWQHTAHFLTAPIWKNNTEIPCCCIKHIGSKAFR